MTVTTRRLAGVTLIAAALLAGGLASAQPATAAPGQPSVVATVPVDASPGGVAVSPDGTRAYVANGGDNANSYAGTVSVIATP